MRIDPVNEIVEGTKAMHEAAAEIRRLRAEVEGWERTALKQADETIPDLKEEVERLRAECKRYADNHDQVVGWLRIRDDEITRLRRILREHGLSDGYA